MQVSASFACSLLIFAFLHIQVIKAYLAKFVLGPEEEERKGLGLGMRL